MSAGFNIEKWLTNFMDNWLDYLTTKTVDWVTNALKADEFNPIKSDIPTIPHYSSSVRDLFQFVFAEFEFISGLNWSNSSQLAGFYQRFAKIVNLAVEQYSDAISLGEVKGDPNAPAAWMSTLASFRTNADQPKDIASISCIKLCNVEYALVQLDNMSKAMNLPALVKSQTDFRSAALRRMSVYNPKQYQKLTQETKLSGQLKIHVAYAENLKPSNKNGLSNPYIIIRVPEGTEVPPSVSTVDETKDTPDTSKFLNGKECELVRTRVIYDAISASWDDTFECIVPPIERLEVQIFSKNMISSDELLGSSVIDLSVNSRLRQRMSDHQTYDVMVEIEPQGRTLLRLTLEGSEEDVAFWFRKSRERSGRTKDDFLRSIVGKISPYSKDVLTKSIKKHEAAPVSKTFLSSLSSLTAQTEYSNLNASGASVDQPVSAREADEALEPLTDYLNKNLQTICEHLPTKTAQKVVLKAWEDALMSLELILVPNLFGQIDRDRRILNKRQVSMANWIVKILFDFFHADGADLGLPRKVLQTAHYSEVTHLLSIYHQSIDYQKNDYTAGVRENRNKDLVLRLIRQRIERDDDLSTGAKEEGKRWLDIQFERRKRR